MANTTDIASSGTDFDGTPNNGEIEFTNTEIGKDSTRAILYSVSVTTGGTTLTSARAVLAPSVAQAIGNGPFLELAIVSDAAGFTLACCNCVVPAGWKLFIFTTEDSNVDKRLFADWSVETLIPRF